MQSMVFSKALANRGALFKQQVYPDEGHNLAGVKKHLYRSMTLFLDECFKKQVQNDFYKVLQSSLNENDSLFFLEAKTFLSFLSQSNSTFFFVIKAWIVLFKSSFYFKFHRFLWRWKLV